MKKGFTLIEMLVSVALFSIVMVVALGALLSLSVATRKAESINSTVNNLAAAVDSMSRSIRTGQNYHCDQFGTPTDPHDCSTPNSYFSYRDFNGSQVTYCLSDPSSSACNSGSASCGTGTCTILRRVIQGTSNSGFVPLTSPEVNITSLAFYVEGSGPKFQPVGKSYPTLDAKQPKVTIIVAGTVPVTANQNTKFNLQTTLTQRIFDI